MLHPTLAARNMEDSMARSWTPLLLLLIPFAALADEARFPAHAIRPSQAPPWQTALRNGDAAQVTREVLRLALNRDARLMPSPEDPKWFIPELKIALRTVKQAPQDIQSQVLGRFDLLARTAWEAMENHDDSKQLERFIQRYGMTTVGPDAYERLGAALQQQGRRWEAVMAWREAARHATESEQRIRLRQKLSSINEQLRQLGLASSQAAPNQALFEDPLRQLMAREEYELPAGTKNAFVLPNWIISFDGLKLYAKSRLDGKVETWQDSSIKVQLFEVGQRLFGMGRDRLVCFAHESPWRPEWQLEASRGDLWQRLVVAQPVVSDDRCYVAFRRVRDANGLLGVACLDLNSGKVLWHEKVCEMGDERSAESVQLVSSAHAILVIAPGIMMAFDGMRGQPLWGRTWKPDDTNTPPLAGTSRGTLALCHSRTGRVDVFQGLTGEHRFTRYLAAGARLVAVTPERLILANESGLMAWGVEDGTLQWAAPGRSHDVQGPSAIVVDDTLWWSTADGMVAIDVATGRARVEPAWLRHVTDGAISWRDGMLWVRTGAKLHGFGPPRQERGARLGRR